MLRVCSSWLLFIRPRRMRISPASISGGLVAGAGGSAGGKFKLLDASPGHYPKSRGGVSDAAANPVRFSGYTDLRQFCEGPTPAHHVAPVDMPQVAQRPMARLDAAVLKDRKSVV